MRKTKRMIPVAGTKPEPISMDYFNVPRLPEPEVEEKDDRPNWRDRVREIVTPIWFDYHGSHFFDGDGKMIAQIRGWGGLTSSGLSDEEAREIQEKNAAYIVNAVNEHETLTATISALTEQVSKVDGMANEINILVKENRELEGKLAAAKVLVEKLDTVRPHVYGWPYDVWLPSLNAFKRLLQKENTDGRN